MMIARTRKKPARGLTTVAVLICLIVITLVSGVVLKVGLARRRQVRAQEHRLQAEWLAESGIRRAVARLEADPAYGGETWELGATELGLPESDAVVTIAVRRLPEDPDRREVRAQADYPRDPSLRSRHTKQIVIEIKKGTTDEHR